MGCADSDIVDLACVHGSRVRVRDAVDDGSCCGASRVFCAFWVEIKEGSRGVGLSW